MAPISRFFHMMGQTAFAIVYSLIHTGVVLLATMLLFDISLSNANLIGFLLLLIAGSLSFIGISIVGSVLPLLFPERGSQMTHLIIALLFAGLRRVLPGGGAAPVVASPLPLLARHLCD